jgi:hypothetical protein
MSIFPDDSWSVGTVGDDDDELILVRARTAPPSDAVREAWPDLVVVTWPYEPASGMPQAADAAQMEAFEDAVADGVERAGSGVLVATLTGAGHKEWRYYAPDSDAFLAALEARLKDHPVYPLEIEVFTDSAWQGLAELLPGEGDGDEEEA